MPDPSNYDNEDDWMEACVPTMMDEGRDQDQAVAACLSMWRERDKAVPPLVDRAWSTLTVKSVDSEQRTIEGMASTPTVDRVGDIVEPMGAKFTLPMPLLHHHKHDQPVGHVVSAKPTKQGISIKAQFAKVAEPGALKDRIDTAWGEVKAGLVRGLSIGFKPIDYEFLDDKSGGLRFNSWSWYELSLVTIPANQDANISIVKSLDQDQGLPAASGTTEPRSSRPGASGKSKSVNLTRSTGMSKTFAEQIADLENTRAAALAGMGSIMQKAVDEGRSTDESEQNEFEDLEAKVESVDKDLKMFRVLEKTNREQAKPVAEVKSVEDGSAARGGHVRVVQRKPEQGIQFARMAKCIAMSRMDMRSVVDVAQELYGDRDPDIVEVVKSPVNAAVTTAPAWAGNLVGNNFAIFADFIDFLRPRTILGRFGTDGIPSLTRVPFRVALVGQTSGGAAWWVGEAAAKPVTKFDFSRTVLEPLKVANIAVLSEEVVRDSSPSAEAIVRDQLARAVAERLDIDFIDPAKAAVAGISPASITNGVSPTASSGNDLTNLYVDIQALMNTFLNANNQLATGVWLMRESVALTLSMIRDPLMQTVFPGIGPRGGTLFGMPVITSQYIPKSVQSPADDSIILVNAEDIYLADEGGVQVDLSREASLQMDNAPSMTGAGAGGSPNAPTATSVVSLWQANLVGLRCERTINWARRRTTSVAVLSGANYALS